MHVLCLKSLISLHCNNKNSVSLLCPEMLCGICCVASLSISVSSSWQALWFHALILFCFWGGYAYSSCSDTGHPQSRVFFLGLRSSAQMSPFQHPPPDLHCEFIILLLTILAASLSDYFSHLSPFSSAPLVSYLLSLFPSLLLFIIDHTTHLYLCGLPNVMSFTE